MAFHTTSRPNARLAAPAQAARGLQRGQRPMARAALAAAPPRRVAAQAASLSLAFPVSGSVDAADAPAGPFNGDAAAAPVSPRASGGSVTSIHTPEELYQALEGNRERLVCLMCKATGCRPCKVFLRKYKRMAASLPDCVFLEVTGDETNALRKLMIQMNVRATPTFRIYKGGECVKTTTGIDEDKLRTAINECLAGQQGESDL